MGISLNVNLSRSARRFELDISQLPVTAQRTNSKVLGVVLMIFALVWGGFPVVGLVTMLGEGQAFEPVMMIILLFPVIAVGILLYGVHQLVWRKTITLDRQFVAVVERGLRSIS